MTSKAAIELLKSIRHQLASKYPIAKIGIFGSFARQENTADSDIDILVEFSSPIGLGFINLANELEDIFKQKVDLVSLNGIKEKYRNSILEDVIYV